MNLSVISFVGALSGAEGVPEDHQMLAGLYFAQSAVVAVCGGKSEYLCHGIMMPCLSGVKSWTYCIYCGCCAVAESLLYV